MVSLIKTIINRPLAILSLMSLMLFAASSVNAQANMNLSVRIDVGDANCGANDGILNAVPDGGLAPYTYLWSNGATTALLTGLAPGIYTVTVTDQASNTANATATVGQNGGYSISLVPTYETCAGSSDAKIDIVFDTPGTAPYTYLWSNGQTGFRAEDVGAGNYSVTVTDATGCTATASTTVELSPEGIWTMTSSTPANCGMNNGTAHVSVMTGTAPFTIVWSDGQTGEDPVNLAPGTYGVTVTDANGCVGVNQVTVDQAGSIIDISLVPTYETCAGSSDAKIDIVFNVPGTAPYTYAWSNGQTGFQAINVGAGNYSVTITDANGCTATASTTVELSPEGIWVMTSSTPATCGQSNGTAHISVMTGTAPFTIVWSDGQTGEDPVNLAPGTYGVTVTDANGCQATDQVTVGQSGSTIAINVSATPETCSGSADGTVSITFTSGGNAPYTYAWSNGQTSASLSGVSAGNYSVTVTDQDGCTATGSATVSLSSTALSVSGSATPVSCAGGNDGSASATVSGGSAPYSYSWSGGLTGSNVTGLSAGTYGVTVTDANGCQGSAQITVSQPAVINIDISTTKNTDCNNPNGSITTNVSGGTGSYTYAWSNNSTGTSLNNLSAGTYSLTVTDANGCTAAASPIVVEDDCTVNPPSCISPVLSNVVVVEATCGNSDGKATVNVANDPGRFNYNWSPAVSTSKVANGIPAGTYSVTISDPLDPTACQLIEIFTVGNSDGPKAEIVQTTPATCREANGTATLSPIGFQYDWCNGATGNNVTNLTAGECQVTITDLATNCTNVIEVVIDEFNPLMASPRVDRQPDCNMANGEVTIEVSGGSFSYEYDWSNGGSGANQTGLTSGSYEVTVTDNGPTGCVRVINFVLLDNVPGIDVDIDPIIHTSCPGVDDANADYTLTPSAGFAGPPQVTIKDSNGNTVNATNLAPGNYCIEVRDNDNCLAGGACFEVRYPSQIDVDVSIANKNCATGGTIGLVISGGFSPYTVNWADLAGNDNEEDRDDLEAGNYGFTVTDSNGCTAFEDIVTIEDDCNCVTPRVQSVVVIESRCGQDAGSAVIEMVGGSSNYNYQWSPPVSGDNQAFNIPADVYSVTITDPSDASCFMVETFSVGNSDGPAATYSAQPANCGLSDGSITLSPANFTYEWTDGFTGSTRTNLEEGRYFVSVTDPNDPTCFDIETVVVGSVNSLVALARVDQLPDCNASNGAVTIEVDGGSGNYDYLWSDGSTQGSRTGLASGIYQLEITDQQNPGCARSLLFTLRDNVPGVDIALDSTVFLTNCVGSDDAMANFTQNPLPGFAGPGTTIIIDANGNVYTNGQLPVGSYCIIVRDANNCLAGGDCFDVESPDQIDMDLAYFDAGCTNTEGRIEISDISGGNGGYKYDWTDLAGTDDPSNRNDLGEATYVLNVSDRNGCSVTASVIIDGNTNPISLTAPDDMITCDDEIRLTVNSPTATSYQWYDEDGNLITTNPDTLFASDGMADRMYYVVATDASGCTATDSVFVTEGRVDLDLDLPGIICAGGTTQLSVTNLDTDDDLTFNWGPSNLILSGGNTPNPVIDTDQFGTQTLTLTVTNQFDRCPLEREVDIKIADTRIRPDLITKSQCDEDAIKFSVDIDSADLTFYTWNFGDPNNPTASDTGQVVNYTYPGPGNYIVTLTLPANSGCPTDTVSFPVEVVPPPLAQLDFDWEYDSCSDTAVIQLTDLSTNQLGDITDWTWTFNGGDTSRIQNPSLTVDASGTIIVGLQIETADGCIENLLDTINIALIEVNLDDLAACPGADIQLNTDGNADYTYQWSPDSLISDTGAASPMLTVNGDYTISVTINDPSTGCEIEREFLVDARTDLMDIAIDADTLISCDGADETVTVQGTGIDNVVWTNANGSELGTQVDLTVSPGEPGASGYIYTLVKDRFGCTAEDSVLVENRSVQFEFLEEVVNVCLGFDKLVEATITLSADEELTYEWTPNDIIIDQSVPGNPVIQPTEDGTLGVVVTNQYGCTLESSIDYDVINLDDEISLSTDKDTTCELGETVRLEVTDRPDLTYVWTPGESLDRTDISDPVATPTEDTQYNVEVTDENGCVANRSKTIRVIIPECEEPWIFFPNAFTPNNDGANDFLQVYGFNIDEVYWVIYNRWGEKVYEANNKDDSWDGTFKGEQLSSDVYGYYLRVRCVDGNEFYKQGNVSLIR